MSSNWRAANGSSELVRNLVRSALGNRGYQVTRRDTHDLVWRDYYSPLPDLEDIPESFWDTERPMAGVDLRVDAAVELLQGPLAPYLAEFQPPFDRVDEGFFLDNNAYGPVNAEVLYAVVRYLQPARIVELGSGVSSHVIAAGPREKPDEGGAHRLRPVSVLVRCVRPRHGRSRPSATRGGSRHGGDRFRCSVRTTFSSSTRRTP